MATIRVKLADGRTGTIDDSEYDANSMTQLDAPQEQTTTTPTTATTPPPQPQQAQQKGVLAGNGKTDNLFSGGGLLSGILNAVAQPLVRTGRQIVGAGQVAVNNNSLQKDIAATEANTKAQQEIMKKIKAEKDPEKKKALLEQSRKLSGLGEQNRVDTTKTANNLQNNTVLTPEELKMSSDNPLAFIGRQAATSAELPLYALGGGGGALGKIINPTTLKGGMALGAGAGAAAGISNDQGIEDIAKNAVLGGALGGAAPLLGKGLGLLGKGEQTAGRAISDDLTKIRLPANVYGADAEKAVRETLRKRGVTGTPQQQYAKLNGAVSDIETELQDLVAKSTTTHKVDDIVNDLKTSAKGIRLSGTPKEKVSQEVNSFVRDLYDEAFAADGGVIGDTLTDAQLVTMKRELNSSKIVADAFKKQNAGQALTDREKVAMAAWDSIDSAIKTSSPEIKSLLKEQSNIYKSVSSVEAARDVAPQASLLGNQAPRPVGQFIQNTAGAGLEKTGKATSGLGGVLSTLGSPANVARGEVAAGNFTGQPTQSETQAQTPGEGKYNVVSDIENQPEQAATPGEITPEILKQAAMLLSSSEYEKVKKMYDAQKLEKPQPATAGERNNQKSAESGLRALYKAQEQINGDQSVIAKAAIPGSLGARTYKAAANEIKDVITRLRTGAALNKDEADFYNSQLPSPLDPPETISYKLKLYNDLFRRLAFLEEQKAQ